MKAWTTVYSYMWPEVKTAIAETLFGPLLPKDANPKDLLNGFLSHFVQSPKEMDELHIPIINKWINLHKKTLSGITDSSYQFSYPTAGSEEGIREFMTYLLSEGVDCIYVLKGEYEGYSAVSESRSFFKNFKVTNNITSNEMLGNLQVHQWPKVREVKIDEIEGLKPSWFFISNPSARDGNIIPNEVINKICEAGHSVFYDLAYLDSTRPHMFDLSHPNIKTIVMSMSKTYGLFYWRMGALISREAVPSLYGNKWFKVVPSLLIADTVFDTIDPNMLYQRYRPIQCDIVQEMRSETGLPIEPSDALLLAHIKPEKAAGLNENETIHIGEFKRADGYRFCLTPYYRGAFG